LRSDATGFYGAVDLPPGAYAGAATYPGLSPKTNKFLVNIGNVTSQDFFLEPQ
jgi:hypothetical protein